MEHMMAAENFHACLAFTLTYEGGKSDDPQDPGGRTMEGVTQATYDAYRRKKAIERRDVFMIEAAERNDIYRNEYWDRVKAGAMLPGEDLCVFDLAVNSGPAKALAVRASVLKTANISTSDLISGICARRLSFLHALRTWSQFGRGWGRRIAACEALAIRMAYGKKAPKVLARKAGEANVHSGKKSAQAVVGGTIAGSATIAHAIHGGMSGAAETSILAVVAIIAGIFLFHAWRQSQRAAAFVTEARQ